MTTEVNPIEEEVQQTKCKQQSSSFDAVYGLGLIGAWIFYIGRANSLGEGAMGFLKGLVWPVIVVRGLLAFLLDEE